MIDGDKKKKIRSVRTKKPIRADRITKVDLFHFVSIPIEITIKSLFPSASSQIKMATNLSVDRLLVYCVFILVLFIAPIGARNQHCVKEDCRAKKENIRSLRKFSDLQCDFENDCSNWIDESEGGFNWDIQNYDSTSWGNESPAPPDVSNEKKYIRVHRWASSSTLSTFGVAILRSQPFTFLPDEDAQFSFSFWIRSKWPEFNNLQVMEIE